MNKGMQARPMTAAEPVFRWPSSEIRAQLDRILHHSEFHATDKMRAFLRFVVEETLAGRAKHIKGFTIATEVYGRGADFDAAHDPVVRIQAGRLRRAMERYYLVTGGQDLIRIEIPTGSYVPKFTGCPGESTTPGWAGAAPAARSWTRSWPTLLVMPFEDHTGNPELAYISVGLATELCLELAHCDDLRIMLYREDSNAVRKRDRRTDFIVRGSVRSDGKNIKVVVHLIDGMTREQLWVDSLKSPLDVANFIAFQENAANSISAHIAGTHGVIARRMSMQLDRRSPAELTTYQAILKGYACHHTLNASTYMQALEALELARSKNPECGLVCTMLALHYMDNIVFEFLELERTPLDEAVHLAREGALALPGNQFCRLALARGHMLKDELDMACSEVEASLAMHPESLLFMDFTGYMMLLLGEWDRGEQLVRKAIRLNPFHHVLARYGLWYNAIRQRDYETALNESEWTSEIGYFWGPLARAITLGLMGRSAAGRDAVEQVLLLKPNFQTRGRLLIGHYVKFPEIMEQMVAGLSNAGLDLD